jgi:hypothetical protein
MRIPKARLDGRPPCSPLTQFFRIERSGAETIWEETRILAELLKTAE